MPASFFISDSEIRVVKGEYGKHVKTLKAQLPQGLVVDGFVKEKEKLKAIVKQVNKIAKLHDSDIVLSLAEGHVFTKKIVLPASDSGSDEDIKRALETLLPLDRRSYTDWQIIERNNEGVICYFASAQAELLEGYIDLFEELSLRLIGIEPLACAIVRNLPKQEGATFFSVVFDGDEVLLIISKGQGSIELTSSIPRKNIGDAKDIGSEIEQMLAFYKKKIGFVEQKDKPFIAHAFLAGDGVSTQLRDELARILAVGVDFLIIPKAKSQGEAVAFYPLYAHLNLQEVYTKTHQQINLLPEESLLKQQDVKKVMYWEKLTKAGAYLFGALCLVYLLLGAFFFYSMRTTDGQIKDKRNELIKNKTTQVVQQINTVNKTVSFINQMKNQDTQIAAMLQFLSSKTPGGIAITYYEINTDTGKILVSGLSTSQEQLLAFQSVIEAQEEYEDVSIPLASLEKDGPSTFSLSFSRKKQ